MCWKLKIWSYFSRCTDCTQMVHTESTETNCWYAKQAANTPTPDVFWLCLTICHFNVAQDTHLCPTMLVEYYPLYQLPLLPVHIYPFTFNPTCKLPKSCYIFGTYLCEYSKKQQSRVSLPSNFRWMKNTFVTPQVSQWVQLEYLHPSLLCLV